MSNLITYQKFKTNQFCFFQMPKATKNKKKGLIKVNPTQDEPEKKWTNKFPPEIKIKIFDYITPDFKYVTLLTLLTMLTTSIVDDRCEDTTLDPSLYKVKNTQMVNFLGPSIYKVKNHSNGNILGP